MPPKRKFWIDRIKEAWKEFIVATLASQLIDEHLRDEPRVLRSLLIERRDVERYRGELESTYLIRVYAAFEAGLRDAWRHRFGRKTYPKMEVLIDCVRDLCGVPLELAESVHEVREYRNDVVHDTGTAPPVPLDSARHRLCAYFSRLPLDW